MLIETLFTLGIEGREIDVELWTDFLELKPLECCKCGQLIPVKNSRSISTFSYWTIGIRKSEANSLNTQLSDLLDLLHSKASRINKLIEEFNLDSGIASFIWVGDNADFSDVDLYLDASNIKRLADLNADFAVRIYEQ